MRFRPVSDHLLPGDKYARARYAELGAAVGGEGGFHRAVQARLAAWTDKPNIDALASMIRERVDGETSRYRDLLAEVAHHLSTTGAPAGEGWLYAVLPTVLAALIREAAREGDQP
jgi:hypothetical protein